MEILIFLMLVGLIIYSINISNRLSKLEKGGSQPALEPIVTKVAKASPAPKPAATSSAQSVMHEPLDAKSFINLLPKIGIVALIIGLGFFLKYAIDQGWVSVNMRLLIGAAVGTLLMTLYYLWRNKYAKYALTLAGGGIAVWYLTVYAAVNLYHLFSIEVGLGALTVVSIIGLSLAYVTSSKVLSGLAWGAAFLAPLVLKVSKFDYDLLLVYVSIVNITLVISTWFNRERFLFALGLLGISFNLLFTSNLSDTLSTYYLHNVIFLVVNLVVITAGITAVMKKDYSSEATGDHSEFGLLYVVSYFFLGIPFVFYVWNHFHDLAPIAMIGLAVWTFLIYVFVDRLENRLVNYVLVLFGSASLALAIVWQFNSNTETILLYAAGILGLLFGRFQNRQELRAVGLLLIFSGIFDAIHIPYESTDLTLLLNHKFILEGMGIGALIIGYLSYPEQPTDNFEKNIHDGLQYLIGTLVWLFVSWDIIHSYQGFELSNQRNLIMSLWWLVYAVILLGISSMISARAMRRLALIIFVLVIVKVFLYDVQNLDTVYRIISFITLGAILLIVSFVYQHNKERIKHYLES